MKKLILLLFFQITFSCIAQNVASNEEIKRSILDARMYKLDGSEIQNLQAKKLLIIDFWSFNCRACLASFRRLDSLQLEFGEDIQIILVNPESVDDTRNLFRTRPKLHRPGVSMISGDTTLHKLFPHEYVPYLIWLDTAYTVVQTSTSTSLNRSQLRGYLSGNTEYTGVQEIKYVPDLLSNELRKNVREFTYWAGYMPNYKIRSSGSSEGTEFLMANASIEMLYKYAYWNENRRFLYEPNSVIYEVGDLFPLVWPSNKDTLLTWLKKHAHTYHYKSDRSSTQPPREKLKTDLAKRFSYKISFEKRPVNCIVLRKTEDFPLFRPNQDSLSSRANFSSNSKLNDNRGIFIQDRDWSKFSAHLRNYINRELEMRFVDDTKIQGLVNIEIPRSIMEIRNIEKLNHVLRTYGLALYREKQMVDVMIVRE